MRPHGIHIPLETEYTLAKIPDYFYIADPIVGEFDVLRTASARCESSQRNLTTLLNALNTRSLILISRNPSSESVFTIYLDIDEVTMVNCETGRVAGKFRLAVEQHTLVGIYADCPEVDICDADIIAVYNNDCVCMKSI